MTGARGLPGRLLHRPRSAPRGARPARSVPFAGQRRARRVLERCDAAAVEGACSAGRNAALFGGDTWWPVACADDVTYFRERFWREAGQPENTLIEVGFRSRGGRDRDQNPLPVDCRVRRADHWVYAGRGVRSEGGTPAGSQTVCLRSAFLHKLIELAVGRPEVRVAMAAVLSRLVDLNTRCPQLRDRRAEIGDQEADGARRRPGRDCCRGTGPRSDRRSRVRPARCAAATRSGGGAGGRRPQVGSRRRNSTAAAPHTAAA
jgi:hypothetical protein